MDLVLCSCFTASAVVVFIAAAARMEAAQDSLYESGMLQALYTVTLPLGCSSSAYIAAVWLEFLPAQVIRLPCSVLSLRMPERTAALAESCLRKHYPKKTKYLFQEVPRRNAPTLCSKNNVFSCGPPSHTWASPHVSHKVYVHTSWVIVHCPILAGSLCGARFQ